MCCLGWSPGSVGCWSHSSSCQRRLPAGDPPGSSLSYIAFLGRGMQSSSETHSLFASPSKLIGFLLCCCLIFLDTLVQEIPVVVQEKHIDLSALFHFWFLHPACAEQVTLMSSHASFVHLLPPKPPSILFCLGWLFCWMTNQLPSHPFFSKCQRASAALTAPESLWHFGVTGLYLLSVLILFDFQY